MNAISPVSSNAAPTTSAPPAPTSTDQLGADTFLQLLVAQLKYQDPTAPSDGADFLAQTAQFTMVEKLTELAEQAARSETMNRNLAAASLVGQTVSWLRADGTTGTGIVGSAQLGSAGPVLTVGKETVAFDTISAVSRPPSPAPAPAAPASPTPATGGTTDESPAAEVA